MCNIFPFVEILKNTIANGRVAANDVVIGFQFFAFIIKIGIFR